jgi:pimeloyl-ACP methyl ester carboxylesterase
VPVPQIRYVENDGVNIAYARWGEGREPVVYLPPWVTNIELMWELPEFARAYDRAGRYSDVIMIDKRGVGMSDRTTALPTLEERVNDSPDRLALGAMGSCHDVCPADCCTYTPQWPTHTR